MEPASVSVWRSWDNSDIFDLGLHSVLETRCRRRATRPLTRQPLPMLKASSQTSTPLGSLHMATGSVQEYLVLIHRYEGPQYRLAQHIHLPRHLSAIELLE